MMTNNKRKTNNNEENDNNESNKKRNTTSSSSSSWESQVKNEQEEEQKRISRLILDQKVKRMLPFLTLKEKNNILYIITKREKDLSEDEHTKLDLYDQSQNEQILSCSSSSSPLS